MCMWYDTASPVRVSRGRTRKLGSPHQGSRRSPSWSKGSSSRRARAAVLTRATRASLSGFARGVQGMSRFGSLSVQAVTICRLANPMALSVAARSLSVQGAAKLSLLTRPGPLGRARPQSVVGSASEKPLEPAAEARSGPLHVVLADLLLAVEPVVAHGTQRALPADPPGRDERPPALDALDGPRVVLIGHRAEPSSPRRWSTRGLKPHIIHTRPGRGNTVAISGDGPHQSRPAEEE